MFGTDFEDLNNINNNNQESFPYIKEISFLYDMRKIKIFSWKGNIIALIIFLCIQLILTLVAFLAFNDNHFIKLVFCIVEVPSIIVFILAPSNAICKYDYTNKVFSSYITPIIPIPYYCFSTKVNFHEISGFFLNKIKKYNKKYYQIGVKLNDGSEQIIIVGQDHTCKSEFDEKLDYIPYILRALLKSEPQNII